MNSKIVTFSVLFVFLFGCAFCSTEEVEGLGIKLHVFDSSNHYWIAVDPRDDLADTVKVEMKDASSDWIEMTSNPEWGYFQTSANSDAGFELPVSFRLTSESGEVVTLDDVLTSIVAGNLVHTRSQYSGHSKSNNHGNSNHGNGNGNHGNGNGNGNGNHGNGNAPTKKPTTAPTKKPTTAPTQRPTNAPTTAPTKKPTTAPTNTPTSKPTTKPSSPTTTPTTKPTTKPTTPPASGDLCAVTSTASEPVKLLVPLYMYPGSAWDEIVTAANSGVQIIAIINPNSGPVASGPDSSYTTYMTKLKNAGVTMVGYVHTSYGTRDLATVESEIDTYASKYPGVVGIFLDEASADASEISYYTSVYSHITSKGMVHSILNPGTQPAQGYVAISTNIVIFESDAGSYKSNFASWVTCAPSAAQKSGYKYHFSGIAYAASSSQMTSLVSEFSAAGMGLVYVTDGTLSGGTYNTLPSYFSSESSAVDALN